MATFMKWLQSLQSKVRNWKNVRKAKKTGRKITFSNVLSFGFYWIKKLARAFAKLVFLGIILHIVASYFCPNLPEKFPAIYGLYTGFAQLGEFILKTFVSGLYNLFTSNWARFCSEFKVAESRLIQQFINWLIQLHF